MSILPKITKAEIENTKNDSWEFLFLLLDKYFEVISQHDGQVPSSDFNSAQHTLMAYSYLYGEVCNGGFIQLIHNGYGGYTFDSPLSETLKNWSVEGVALIIDEARVIYETLKNDLEQEASPEEFSQMYKDYSEFQPLDDRFYKIMDEQTDRLAEYVKAHLEEFAEVENT